MNTLNHARALAANLLQIKAIRLSPYKPYTWASGLQCPVYCDNRLLLSYPDFRNQAIDGIKALAQSYLPFDIVAGVATAGIPHGMLLADRLHLPFVYVRSQAKAHGKGNQIEGELREGQRVLVVEDLISTGGSSLQAVEALRSSGADVAAVIALFSYGFKEASQRFAEANMPLATVSDYATVIALSKETGTITPDEFTVLDTWYKDPRSWSEKHLAASL